MTSPVEQSLERLRVEANFAYRMIFTMLAGVEDGSYTGLSLAIDACDAVIAAEGDLSTRQWQDVARHLSFVVATQLAARMGPDAATQYMQTQVELALDPDRFRAAVRAGL